MSEAIQLIITIVSLFGLVFVGWAIGRFNEQRHLANLDRRESELSDIVMTDTKRMPEGATVAGGVLVHGEVVIATDYFKVFAAGIRNLFGGEVQSYRSLVTRARREAIVRMLEQARGFDANAVWNVRLATSTIGGQERKQAGGVEVIAYGTALRITQTEDQPSIES